MASQLLRQSTDEERVPILNVLYQKLADTQLECLLNLKENDFMFNKILSSIISSYFRDIFFKTRTLPNEIKAFITKYAQLSVLKYEINIYNGTFDDKSMKSINKSEYMTLYEENIYEKHIAFSVLKLGELFPKEITAGYISLGVEQFSIRIRAILNNETKCKYSEWINFQTTSTFVCDVGISDDFTWIKDFNDFWKKNNLGENIDRNQWLLLFKNCGLNRYELKRIYYYILRACGDSLNNEKIFTNRVLYFVHIDVYRTYDRTYFVCDEWYNFRTILQRFLFPNRVEYGRKVEAHDNL